MTGLSRAKKSLFCHGLRASRWRAMLHCATYLTIIPALMSCERARNKIEASRSGSEVTTISKITPIAVKPNEVVSLTGTNFYDEKNLKVSLDLANGQRTTVPLAIADTKTASFTMPDGAGLGVKDVTLTQGTAQMEVLKFNLIADQADNQLPILIDSPSEICSTKQYIDRNGDKKTGTKDCSAVVTPPNCSSNGQQSCVATGSYFAGAACIANGSGCYLPTYAPTTQPLKAIDYDNINSNAARIRASTILGGVTGTLADCTTNAAAGCVTTATYKSADLTNLSEGNIKSGVTIAGTLGKYPNSTYPLTGSSGTDLTSATFNAQIKSSATFRYFGSDGTLYTGAGDTDITSAKIASGVDIFGALGTVTPADTPDPWDVRVGKTINGVAGKLKVNCRNRVVTGVYNYDGDIALIGSGERTGGSVSDIWDTIDDHNYDTGLPTSVVTAWGNNTDCGGVEATAGDGNVWKDVTTTNGTTGSTCTATPANCTMQDKITGLSWSKLQSNNQSWNTAWATCAGLTYNGQPGWRLPTQKELLEAYNHSIVSAASSNWMTELDINSYFWSGSSVSYLTASAWYSDLVVGITNYGTKNWGMAVVCVR